MIDLAFDPDLLLGPLHLTWHALFGFLGIVAGAATGIAYVRRRLPIADGYAVAVYAVLGGLIGSRLFHVADAWSSTYQYRPIAALEVWTGGASIVGGIVGGLIAGGIVLRIRRLPLRWTFDHGVIGLPFGMAVGRIGDIVNGEHWATACAGVPWCVRYTAANSPGQRDFVHPAVAYELLCDLAIFAILIVVLPWSDRQRRHPHLPFVFLGLYGGARLALSAFRLDPIFAFGMTQAQLASIAFIVLSIGALAWLRRAGPTIAS
ncbi:MAG TPA: prolipoprotein diacylglyceryl transferase family protein [Candidatus Limnocylindria bacterium]|nr:prolipoprotein diacylglyceryl transferase family protein [Candidatus Limnocylindria bacterium]